MRFSKLPISPASLAATTIVAAALGMATVTWTASDRPSIHDMPVMYEEMTVTAEAGYPGVLVGLRPTRDGYIAGETIEFEAVVENASDEPQLISASGLYDLAVQRISSPDPMSPGSVTFLALAEVGGDDALVLAPGETITRIVSVGAEQPFDLPGRYRVSGSWLGADVPSKVGAFDVVIHADQAIAAQGSPRKTPGA